MKYKISDYVEDSFRDELVQLIIHAEGLKTPLRNCLTLCVFYLNINNIDHSVEGSEESLLTDISQLNKWVLDINFTESFMGSHHFKSFLLTLIQNKQAWILWLCYQLTVIKNKKNDDLDKNDIITLSHFLLVPLCNYLGLGYFKSCFEEEAFRLQKPRIFKSLKSQVEVLDASRDEIRKAIHHDLQSIIQEHLSFKVSPQSRTKTLHGIYQKMDRKSILVNSVYDQIAFRFLVDYEEQCYELISLIQKNFKPVQGEYDDYITNPKPNGYQSIHTAVLHDSGAHFEVQVRTKAMHQHAEYGVAAHWVYKESQSTGGEWLSKLLQWRPTEQGESIQSLFQSSKVFVLTPKGEVIALPKGSTGIDAAYAIHTHIGHSIKSLIVNGAIKPLSYQLQTGDVIKIITSKQVTPSMDWLNKSKALVKSSKAIRCIQRWFYHTQPAAAKSVPLQNKTIKIASKNVHKKTNSESLVVQGLNHLAYNLAQCCQPSISDLIVVNITRKRGLMVHKKSCSNMNTIDIIRIYNATWE
ncbi:MAG TPA: TGS domain-containing protein [Gammaproteobacteria bacterium]|nr:TGS domain-containing protein [Gammaproteobacteria bacterium]